MDMAIEKDFAEVSKPLHILTPSVCSPSWPQTSFRLRTFDQKQCDVHLTLRKILEINAKFCMDKPISWKLEIDN